MDTIEGIPVGMPITVLPKQMGAWGKDELQMQPSHDKHWPESSQTPHPSYYSHGQRDLYAMFIETYGLESWLRHVEMECIQYLFRCTRKGTHREDIAKVKVICERILEELAREEP